MSGGGDEDGAEKSHEPTPEKLRKAREEGQVPKSNDLNTAAGYAAMLLVGFSFGGAAMSEAAGVLMATLTNAPDLARVLFHGDPSPVFGPILVGVMRPLSIWFIVPMILVLLILVVQQAIVVTPKNVQPKLSRVSILSNAKQKFGRSGLFEFSKSTVKLCIYMVLAWMFLSVRLEEVVGYAQLAAPQVALSMVRMLLDLLIYVVILALAIGVIDLFWQRMEHTRKNMMTRKDLRDEQKDSEGDPDFKGKRRQRAQEIALNAMLGDVPEADVVIVNPTHYAVALVWDRTGTGPPKCVAKGVDEIAARIREIAAENDVPIHSDPPTARALHGTLEVGDYIPSEHFVAVAAAIRFADEMRRKARM